MTTEERTMDPVGPEPNGEKLDREIWLYFAVKAEIPEHITTHEQLDAWIEKSVEEEDIILPDSAFQFYKWEYAPGSGLDKE